MVYILYIYIYTLDVNIYTICKFIVFIYNNALTETREKLFDVFFCLSGSLGTTTPAKIQPKRQFTTLRSYIETTSLNTSKTSLQLEAPSLGVDIVSSNHSQPKSTSQSTRSAKLPNDQLMEPGTKRTVTDIKNTKGMNYLSEG